MSLSTTNKFLSPCGKYSAWCDDNDLIHIHHESSSDIATRGNNYHIQRSGIHPECTFIVHFFSHFETHETLLVTTVDGCGLSIYDMTANQLKEECYYDKDVLGYIVPSNSKYLVIHGCNDLTTSEYYLYNLYKLLTKEHYKPQPLFDYHITHDRRQFTPDGMFRKFEIKDNEFIGSEFAPYVDIEDKPHYWTPSYEHKYLTYEAKVIRKACEDDSTMRKHMSLADIYEQDPITAAEKVSEEDRPVVERFFRQQLDRLREPVYDENKEEQKIRESHIESLVYGHQRLLDLNTPLSTKCYQDWFKKSDTGKLMERLSPCGKYLARFYNCDERQPNLTIHSTDKSEEILFTVRRNIYHLHHNAFGAHFFQHHETNETLLLCNIIHGQMSVYNMKGKLLKSSCPSDMFISYDMVPDNPKYLVIHGWAWHPNYCWMLYNLENFMTKPHYKPVITWCLYEYCDTDKDRTPLERSSVTKYGVHEVNYDKLELGRLIPYPEYELMDHNIYSDSDDENNNDMKEESESKKNDFNE